MHGPLFWPAATAAVSSLRVTSFIFAEAPGSRTGLTANRTIPMETCLGGAQARVRLGPLRSSACGFGRNDNASVSQSHGCLGMLVQGVMLLGMNLFMLF